MLCDVNFKWKCQCLSHVKSLKFHNSYSVVCACVICILFIQEQWKCCIFISLLAAHTFCPHPLPLVYLWVRKDRMKKQLCATLFFPFLPDHHFQHKLWIQGSNMNRKEYDRVPWWFVFLKTPSLSFRIQRKFTFEQKWGHLGLSATPTPIWLVTDMTQLPCTHFKFHWTPVQPGSSRILCS